MPHWTEDEFVSRARTLARAHVGSQTPINDLVEKVARESDLTPDAIRTLGRLTNVAVFQEFFQKKATDSAGDRMVEFEPGDPEVVITRVVKSADVQEAASAVAEAKTAAELPDLMRAERGFCTDLEKVAYDPEPEERTAPKPLETLRLRKLAEELAISVKQSAYLWEQGLEKVARAFKKAPGYGPSYSDFEKAALAEHGMKVRPELEALREDLRLPALAIDPEKVASLSERFAYENTPELKLFSELVGHREKYQVLKVAQRQISERLAAL